jgi:prevent-host-death family protein
MTMSAKPKKAAEIAVPAGEFKAKCLALLDEVDATGRTFVVTKRGRPVARVVPLASTASAGSLIGSLLEEDADLLAPIPVRWEAAR